MSGYDGNWDEVKKNRATSDREIDAALADKGSPAPGLESLAAWAGELREELAAPISAATADTQIVAVAAIAAETPAPAAAQPASPLAAPSRLQRLRRRVVMSSLVSGVFAKVFAASVALATVTGGVAATGALPDAVQDPIATVYNLVGFNFPTSDDSDDEDADDVTDDAEEVEAPKPEDTTVPPDDDDDDDSDDDDSDDDDSDDEDD